MEFEMEAVVRSSTQLMDASLLFKNGLREYKVLQSRQDGDGLHKQTLFLRHCNAYE